MRRRALLLVGVLGLAAVVVSCGVPAEQAATRFGADEVPFGLLTTEPPTTTTSTTPRRPTTEVPLFFVQGDRLVGVRHPLPSPVSLLDTVAALAAGPTQEEATAGLRSVLPRAGAVESVSLAGGIATVALGPSFAALAGTDQILAVAQVVATLTGQPGVGRVAFTLGGAPVAVPRQDGSLASDSVSRDDYAAMLVS